MEEEKLNPNIKSKFIDALRSGRYKQGKEKYVEFKFFQSNKFCAIGVYIDLFLQFKKMTWQDLFDLTVTNEEKYYQIVLEEIKEWGGIDAANDTIILMNDVDNKTFEEIADFIEKNM